MLLRIIGALVFAAGVILAFKLLGAAALGLFGLIGLLAKVLVVVGLSYWGWRWLNAPTTLAKVAGVVLLVAGTALSVPVLAGVVAETVGLIWLLMRAAFAAVLIYAGWRWLHSRSLGSAHG